MNNAQINPFLPTRYERHDRPLIWVSGKVKILEEKECIYVCGTRGSGKTSLLRAIHWLERVENESLIEQVGSNFPGYIGVYFRIPDYVTEALSNIDWGGIYPNLKSFDNVNYDYFSNFIELISIEQICDSLFAFRKNNVFKYSPDEEKDFIINFISESILFTSAFEKKVIPSMPLSFPELKNSCRLVRTEMYLSCTRGNVARLVEKISLDKGGLLVQSFCEKFCLFHSELFGNKSLYFKICIDDCEVTTTSQQIYLNTLVRLHKHPVFWILSFVDRQYEATATLIQNQDLTDADRKIFFLDEMPYHEFKEFCEKVSAIRFKYLERQLNLRQREEGFSLENILGSTKINDLLLVDEERRFHKEFMGLIARAEASEPLRNPGIMGTLTITGKIKPPVYQQYLLEKLFPDKTVLEVISEKGTSFDPFLRRKQVAAFLSMKSEFRLKNAGFAGWEAVIGMSDGCIRDYLELMAELFDSSVAGIGRDVQDFRLRPRAVTIERQRDALLLASKKKASGYNSKVDRGAMRAAKMIEALGHLTHILQSDHTDLSCLRTPERGIFVFNLNDVFKRNQSSHEEARKLVFNTLKKCEIDGLLLRVRRKFEASYNSEYKESQEYDANVLRYRLHARFAAAYGFSYRGAYSEVKLPMENVLALCESPNTVVSDLWASEMAKDISSVREKDDSQGEFDL